MAKEGEKHVDLLSKVANAIERFIERHHKTIVICVSAVVVAAAFYFSVEYIFSKREERANVDFGKVYLVYRSYASERNLEEKELETKFSALVEDFKVVIEKHPKSKAAGKSAYFAGNILYRMGKYEDAIGYFEKGASAQPRFYISYLCQQGVASCQEQLKNYDKAAKIYEEVLEKHAGRYIAPTVLFNLAQVDERANKLQKAEEEYSKIVQTYGWSSWKNFSEGRILLIKNFM